MYQIKRCKECGKVVHVHKVNKHYCIKNIECEHIPEEKRNYATSKDVERYTSNEMPRKKTPQKHQKKKPQNGHKKHHERRN